MFQIEGPFHGTNHFLNPPHGSRGEGGPARGGCSVPRNRSKASYPYFGGQNALRLFIDSLLWWIIGLKQREVQAL